MAMEGADHSIIWYCSCCRQSITNLLTFLTFLRNAQTKNVTILIWLYNVDTVKFEMEHLNDESERLKLRSSPKLFLLEIWTAWISENLI